ncbi:MAG TPA: lipid-A-disaccharide synthase [Candidatus Krumholzibacteria bacterium]|nr:lipid-A-disaccharide synthase [Candidatus Krumholzibacteria bacterium]
MAALQSRGIVLCAGELSGDMHAAHVVAALGAALPGVEVRGMAGERSAAAGMDVRFDHRAYAVIGFTGVLAGLPRFYRLERALRRLIDQADLFIAVDYPGLNLRLCAHAHRRGVPVLYYIGPQIWAWGAGRMEKIKQTVDRMAVVLPFEATLYHDAGVPVEFVGHPFVVDHELPPPGDAARDGVALLPGSRESEVRHLLPLLLDSAERLAVRVPGTRFRIARSPVVPRSLYTDLTARAAIEVDIADDAIEVLSGARAAMVASGTATLQAALLDTPLVVVYRTGALNFALARRLVKIPHVGLVNVLLGRAVAPEFVQDAARPDAIAGAVERLLTRDDERNMMLAEFRALRGRLGGGAGARRVAEMARELIAERHP